ncbi:tandem-95 repeat protein, partial [Xenococcus sp. PCC 7305]|uniref:tandem-95 repeat protein n=1 Tax=Xenococcus sp. PCC 7305 TaxID=102125 RepID=UPI001181BD79
VNDEPIALDDSDITDEDLAVTTAVLANDSDLDEDPLTVTSATDGTNGTTTVNADGTITYTPNPDFNGTDTYTYTIDDGNGGNAPATVAITVNSVNDIPNFTPGDTQNILEDAGAQNLAWAIGPSPGPENEAGQALNFLVENDNPALFAVVPTIAPDGTLTYTPIDDTSGTANVTVTLTDDGGTENGGIDTTGPIPFVINIEPVNDAPGFTAGPDQIVLEDAGAQNITGWATAIFPGPVDEAEQALNFLVENDNPALFAVVPTIAPDGTLTYTPTDDTNGIANVIVTLIDDGGTDNGGVDSSAPVPFVINVTEVNDAPSFIPGPDQIIPEDSGVQSLVWATAISPGPEDEAEQALNFIVSNDNPALFSVEPAIAPDGTLTYGTVDNANGIANVIVTLIDNGDTINGGINTSDSVPFVINVTEVNDAPVINDDSLTTDEDIPVNIVAIANDIDIDGNLNPTSTTVVSPATNGTVVNNGDGTFTYIPNPNYNGFDSFTYQITDAGGLTDIATVGITVNSVNDFPIANDENVTTDEDVPVNIAAIANDIDVDGNLVPTSATIIAQATNGTVVNNGDGTFTYTPNPDYNGLDSFAYQISDAGGLTDIATIGINIIPIEDSIIPNLITEPLNTVGGTGGNDALTGTTDSELLAGFAGNDVLDGRAGNDILDGGPNIDTAVYQSDSAGVNVNLNTGIVNGGFGGTDTLISIENIIGSEFDDNILGNAESNSLTGRNGNDTINGGDGNDFLVGSAGADILNGGAGNDSFIYLSPTEGNDTIEQFATGVDEILIVGALFPGGLSGGVLPLSQFFGGTIATDDNHRFGYDAATGRVLFDQDGEGGQGAQVLATLTGSQGLVNTDIKVL